MTDTDATEDPGPNPPPVETIDSIADSIYGVSSSADIDTQRPATPDDVLSSIPRL